MRILLVDPSLFTAPYDAALTEGLRAANVDARWVARPLRPGDREEIPSELVEPLFYRRTDQVRAGPALRAALKGFAHVAGSARLIMKVRSSRPDVVHYQWAVVPVVDAIAMGCIRRYCPVVLTVHDTVGFNGERMPFLQTAGTRLVLKLASHLIVHTRSGLSALEKLGVPPENASLVAHGPLQLGVPIPERPSRERYQFTTFGEMKAYKGIDVLIEAAGLLPASVRSRARFVVAGRPRIDTAPLHRRISELELLDVVQLREKRLSDDEIAELFADTDCFVFPYRQIDASGVYFLTKGLRKWMIASRIGIFEEELVDGETGSLVTPGSAPELAGALQRVLERAPERDSVPAGQDWAAIGKATAALYTRVKAGRSEQGVPPSRSVAPSGNGTGGRRVLLDGYFFDRKYGFGRYVRELAHALDRWALDLKLALVVPKEAEREARQLLSRTEIIPVTRRTFAVWEQCTLPAVARHCRSELVHFPYQSTALLWPRSRAVATIHDLMFLRPEATSGSRIDRLVQTYRHAVFEASTKHSAKLIAVSEATRQELASHTNLSAVVVPNTCDAFVGRYREATPEHHPFPFLLHRGDRAPHKNTLRTVAAFARAREAVPAARLLIYGGAVTPELLSESVTEGVELLGKVDDSRLAALYMAAAGVVTPSLEEGFGLAIIEAFALGAPVITSDLAPMSTIASGAALLVDPLDEHSIASAMTRLLREDELRASLRTLGSERAKLYSAENVARAMGAVYHDVLDARAG